MNMGQRIAFLREQRLWSQKELAKKLGVSQAYVGQWESGARKVPSEKILELSELFDVSTDFLYGRKSSEDQDIIDLLRSHSLTYGGEEISEDNLRKIAGVVRVFLEEQNE